MGVKAPPSGGAAIATRPCIGNLGTLSAPPGEEEMTYSIAGIDVHKKILVVVVAEVTEQGEWSYERGNLAPRPMSSNVWPTGSNSEECRKW